MSVLNAEAEHNQLQNHSVEISIIPFKFKYLPQLIELHKSQNYVDISCINMKTLPKIGYICLLNDQPIAAGFLRRLEPCFGQIDTLVSNGYFGAQIRHQGIKLVVDTLIEEAKRLKLKGIVSLTADTGILKRAESLGFRIIDQKVITLELPARQG